MLVLAAIVGYLFGTFPSADLVSRVATRGRVDLRRDGSGNPGGLNAMRQIGTGWGIVVVLADLLKGTAGAFAGWAIGGTAGAYAAATTSMAGHIFPVWTGFRGGKGVATSAGACLAVFPAFFPIDAAVAAAGALGSRNPERTIWVNGFVWVSTALIWWGFELPNLWGPPPTLGLVMFSLLGTAMVVGKFRAAALAARRAGT
ncbi:MAG TPA: glycerol-3-phosphate acyltransferase [Acidimicrobiia bacterium]|nr:glycerol-3-phosphate acyltransferase [Acidimicrobiia bacterium]